MFFTKFAFLIFKVWPALLVLWCAVWFRGLRFLIDEKNRRMQKRQKIQTTFEILYIHRTIILNLSYQSKEKTQSQTHMHVLWHGQPQSDSEKFVYKPQWNSLETLEQPKNAIWYNFRWLRGKMKNDTSF